LFYLRVAVKGQIQNQVKALF